MDPLMHTLRIARPTDNLTALAEMYAQGLGLQVLSQFEDHEGFDGIMLGQPGGPYHLEFTRKTGHTAGRAPTEDNLLVFYLADQAQWEAACRRAEAAGFVPVTSFNPFWDRHGRTFEDLDGYRVVLHNGPWRR